MIAGNSIVKFIVFCFLMILIFNPFVLAKDIIIEPYTHTFTYFAPDAGQVSVIGSFNQWNEEKNKMYLNESGYWESKITMDRGIQQYAFLVDGNFKRDPDNNDIECMEYKGAKVWVSYLFIPFYDNLVFPDELESDLDNIQFKFFNSPPYKYYERQSEETLSALQLPELYVRLDVTNDFCNAIFEFTIYNNKDVEIITVSRKFMSWGGEFHWCYRCFEKQIKDPKYIVFRLKSNGKEYKTKCDLYTYMLYGNNKSPKWQNIV